MASGVPNEIVSATENGETATVQNWLSNGGDAQDLQPAYILGDGLNFRLLLLAASNGRTDIVRLLLEHGAEVTSLSIQFLFINRTTLII